MDELILAICILVLLICIPRVIWRNEKFIEDIEDYDDYRGDK